MTARPYVSRAGLKLAHALEAFELDVSGLRCVDLGCNVGGFTDCLLQGGAIQVFAIDTGYGVLDYRLRIDERVTVMERTNALHVEATASVDLAVVDLGWTRQRHALPAAARWLRPGGRIVSLIKPHYEAGDRDQLKDGRLEPAIAEKVTEEVLAGLPDLGFEALAVTRSPIEGAKSGRKAGRGNVEYLVLARTVQSGTT